METNEEKRNTRGVDHRRDSTESIGNRKKISLSLSLNLFLCAKQRAFLLTSSVSFFFVLARCKSGKKEEKKCAGLVKESGLGFYANLGFIRNPKLNHIFEVHFISPAKNVLQAVQS
jgi:hypothetical protein